MGPLAGRRKGWRGGAGDTGEADDMCVFLHRRGQAEVQAVFSDGAVSLHTRSLKYGKVSWALALLFADRHFRSISESPKCSGILTQRRPELNIIGQPPVDGLTHRVRGQEHCHGRQLLSSLY